MKTYHIKVFGYCKGTKSSEYRIVASHYSGAVSRALKQFAKDFKGIHYDKILVEVTW